MANVTLTAALRSNLLSLQNTAKLLDQTQLRLATGLKVNSALDNASSFFTSQTLTNNATDLSNLLDGMGQNVQLLKATDNGLTAITNLLNQALSVMQSATNAAGASSASYVTQYTTIQTQINQLIADTSYNGLKLLDNTNTVTVQFNVGATSTLTLQGVNDAAVAGSLALTTSAAAMFGAGNVNVATTIALETTKINTALATVRTQQQTFAQNLSIIQNRQDFTKNLIDALKEGSDKLVVADKNEEGAKLLSLQTTQQLGIQALSLASQANQSVLRLFA